MLVLVVVAHLNRTSRMQVRVFRRPFYQVVIRNYTLAVGFMSYYN